MMAEYYYVLLIIPILFNTAYSYPLNITEQGILLGINYTTVPDFFSRVFPLKKLDEIERAHLVNDQGFLAAIRSLQSDKWLELVQNVTSSIEYEQLNKMFLEYHFNITKTVDCIRSHINGLVVPSNISAKPDVGSFMQDVFDAFEIINVVKNTLNHPDNIKHFKNIDDQFAVKLENKKVVQAFLDLPAIKEMMRMLKEMNIDVEPYLTLIYAYLRWIN